MSFIHIKSNLRCMLGHHTAWCILMFTILSLFHFSAFIKTVIRVDLKMEPSRASCLYGRFWTAPSRGDIFIKVTQFGEGKMANPIRSLSRPDKRPPAGSKPTLPEWAKGDYVLEKWVGEERQRRRNWLRDQELHPKEPRPEWRPKNPFLERLREPFQRMLNPIDKLTVSFQHEILVLVHNFHHTLDPLLVPPGEYYNTPKIIWIFHNCPKDGHDFKKVVIFLTCSRFCVNFLIFLGGYSLKVKIEDCLS